jgi:electron transfer flavoprotein alpha/beta subunit
MGQSEAQEGNASENMNEFLSLQLCARAHARTLAQHLEKASELLTACSNQSIKNECQHLGNMIAAELRNYDLL